MKPTTMTRITLDGVMQGDGGNTDEERALNGFERGGWARVLDDPATDAAIDDFYARADAFLFGRRTFERSWGSMTADEVPGWERTWRALHDRPKYVASTTLTDPAWAGASVLTGDLSFLVRETAMEQRITRAKAKIRAAGIPYRVPLSRDLPARVSGVLAVLFLVFNEGYLASGPDTDAVRQDLTAEAIRLTRLLRTLLPDDGEVAGLLALMPLTDARREARIAPDGALMALDEQDRGSWDGALIAEGHALVRERLAAAAAGTAPGRYQLLAAIGAVHTSARDVRDTDWSQVIALYDRLAALDPSPVVALDRAIAVGEQDGPRAAMALVERLQGDPAGYHAFHASRADLLRRLGRDEEALAAYDRAIELAGDTAETAALIRRRQRVREHAADAVRRSEDRRTAPSGWLRVDPRCQRTGDLRSSCSTARMNRSRSSATLRGSSKAMK